ncbi:MAG: tRNA (adenosine(37)-N6)-dimethylallyltransferase MiaA [Bacillota bacterium]|nr:tRNA (adenosine(37)-N6)-dimethylallyltransferase MiaA [Bacillota bacterium]
MMNKIKPKLIAIVGPTASGKSSVAIALAKKINGEVVSADSAQVYRGLNIGTAKVTREEAQGIPHHLIDIVGPETEYNIGLFQNDAQKAISEITSRQKIPILCGGSGLYVNSVINTGYELGESVPDPRQRQEWMAIEKTEGAGTLHRILTERFPNRAQKIHPHDYQRILRALEMKTDLQSVETNIHWESPYDLEIYGLTMERGYLYQRIEHRVEEMFQQGLIKEVRNALEMGYRPGGNALNALGYKEILPILNNTYDETYGRELLKKNTRHFAKRQLTWFRRDPRIQWLDMETFKQGTETAEYILRNSSCKKQESNNF